MARVFRHRGLSVYIGDERAERHHLPHAHIRRGREVIWTINLFTLEPMHQGPPMPRHLLRKLAEEQDRMIEVWEGLNDECG